MVQSPTTVKTGSFDWGSALGAAINFGTSALNDYNNYRMNENTNAANAQMVSDTNAANAQIAQNTNAMNAAINAQNIALTREQNAINREREDNAVRRRVNDLIGAGLSKTLAAGSPASANAMQAPQATQGMVTGHAMQSARFNPYRSDNLASAGRVVSEQLLANKELNLRSRALDIEEQNLEETYRHNKAVEDESARGHDIDERYHDQLEKWKKWELDQNSRFHDDAVRLEEAHISIERLNSWSNRNLNAVKELWYQADIDLTKHTDEREAAYLTAALAESTAKVAAWYSDKRLSDAQAVYLQKQIPLIAQHMVSQIKNIDADTKAVLLDAVVKCWNLFIAKKDNGKTTDSTVTASQAKQQNAGRLNNILTGVTRGIVGGASVFMFSTGGKFINKALGMDDHGIWFNNFR